MKKKSYNDEIDLADIILNLWKNKFKIIVITVAFIILGFLYFNFSNKAYEVSTNIKPISTFEAQKYKLFNMLAEEVLAKEVLAKEILAKEILAKEILVEENIIKFNQQNFLNLFINKIQTEQLIEKAITKFQLINKNNFNSDEDYKNQIKKIAISIIDQITPPLEDKKNRIKSIPYWKINFKVTDVKAWRNFLEYIEKQANEEIRLSLISRFNTEMKVLEINSKFEIEDIDQKIENELDDYKISIINRTAFLKEQAEIARTLNIAKNTLEIENFQTDNTIVTNIKSENSYYLKGYEMIEKEINLINSRENEKAFITKLYELEQDKRAILQNKRIERLKNLFLETPIHNINSFKAAKIDYVATNYKRQKSLTNILIISAVVGLLISLMYIFLNNLISSRK